MADQEQELQNAEQEYQQLDYSGYEIPWYVHLIWISFWLLTAYYTIKYIFPTMQQELVSPP